MQEGEDDVEVKTNLIAAYAMCDEVENKTEKIKSFFEKESYELYFNFASCLLETGDLNSAESNLNEAIALCQESLEQEGYSANEIEYELGAMNIQLAYIKQCQEDNEKAELVYSQFVTSPFLSKTVKSVAVNNLLVIRKKRELFDSFKRYI